MSRVQLICEDPSLTHQSFAKDCDIRNIMKQYKRTGLVSHMTTASALYGDFTNVPDYRESLDVVINAQAAFMELPAEVRSRFSNDPAQFLDFVHNPDNRDEMIKLGMIDVPDVVLNSTKTEQSEVTP